MSFKVLTIDDELELCRSLCECLSLEGIEADYSTTPETALQYLSGNQIHLILLDIRMPVLGGITLLNNIINDYPHIPVIMISGNATIENAVIAMKSGAKNLYTKPIDIDKLIDEITHYKKITNISSNKWKPYISQNRYMQEIYDFIDKASPTDATILINGESGTGKEIIAQLIHERSLNKNGEFLKVNCAAISESLLESELFGYEKGAFTGADNLKVGLFEVADGGTIFLDEIGEMSLSLQSKMLRVLQEKAFNRVGGTKIICSDCRIIAATNKDLNKSIAEGSFREDLYYRLAVINIELPSLKDRPDDIIPLSEYFIRIFSDKYCRNIKGIDLKFKQFILNHPWPGNVRELRNFIERAVIFSKEKILSIEDLPKQYAQIRKGSTPVDEKEEKQIIVDTLKSTNGQKGEAARKLNISRKTLYNKIKKYGLE